mmetsp:Transcript_21766/g.54868  ORF Transcript_21766/g.54868 Transcript_21766/m.54868 type:complete len:246 (-) Transcript_21766:121-858(-)
MVATVAAALVTAIATSAEAAVMKKTWVPRALTWIATGAQRASLCPQTDPVAVAVALVTGVKLMGTWAPAAPMAATTGAVTDGRCLLVMTTAARRLAGWQIATAPTAPTASQLVPARPIRRTAGAAASRCHRLRTLASRWAPARPIPRTAGAAARRLRLIPTPASRWAPARQTPRTAGAAGWVLAPPPPTTLGISHGCYLPCCLYHYYCGGPSFSTHIITRETPARDTCDMSHRLLVLSSPSRSYI